MSRGFPDWGAVATTQDAQLPTYLCVSPATFLNAGLTSYALSLFNPATSGMVARIRRLWLRLATLRNAEELNAQDFFLYRTTTLGTGGVAVTPRPLDTASPPSVMTARTNPAVAPTLGVLLAQMPLAQYVSTYPHRPFGNVINGDFEIYRHAPASQEQPLLLRPGQGIALQVPAASLSLYCDPHVFYTEELE